MDAECVGRDASRADVAQQAERAGREGGRIFLTRDQRLGERRGGAGAVLLLGSDLAEEQLRELATHFGLRCVAVWGGHSQVTGAHNVGHPPALASTSTSTHTMGLCLD